MGVQGLYAEIGSGERISLAKYAEAHHQRTGRRLRIAVDESIWSFQAQAAKGGSNAALRTYYYRLVRLLSLNITPLFVFDGPSRPQFKRNKKTHADFPHVLGRSTKRLLKAFGFPHHTAPGEAEAECALLQCAGVVDAVLSEDVDTLMFGSGVTIRNWKAEGSSSSKTPTHVTVYAREDVEKKSGLTPQGMVLVALMRGGDYLPQGVPGCGIKIAVEAARAGFGTELCNLHDGDEEGLQEWRDRLAYELETNESGWFKRRHKTLNIPSGFPNREIFGYYKNPVVSSSDKVRRLKAAVRWDLQPDAKAMREIVRESLEWRGMGGALKLVRTLAPAFLARWCWDGSEVARKAVKGVHMRRVHPSTDGCSEVRISYTPTDVIPIDRQLEEQDDEAEAAELAGILEEDVREEEQGGKGSHGKPYDPNAVEKSWMLESFVRRAVPEKVDGWDAAKAAKATPRMKATTSRRPLRRNATDSRTQPTISPYFAAAEPEASRAAEKSPSRTSTPTKPPRKAFGGAPAPPARQGHCSTQSLGNAEGSPLADIVNISGGRSRRSASTAEQSRYKSSPETSNISPSSRPRHPCPQTAPHSNIRGQQKSSSYDCSANISLLPTTDWASSTPLRDVACPDNRSSPQICSTARHPPETLDYSPPRGRRVSATRIYGLTPSPNCSPTNLSPRSSSTANLHTTSTPMKALTHAFDDLALSPLARAPYRCRSSSTLGRVVEDGLVVGAPLPEFTVQEEMSLKPPPVGAPSLQQPCLVYTNRRHYITPLLPQQKATEVSCSVPRPVSCVKQDRARVDTETINRTPEPRNALDSPNVSCRRRRRPRLRNRIDDMVRVSDGPLEVGSPQASSIAGKTGSGTEVGWGAEEKPDKLNVRTLKVALRSSLPGAWEIVPDGKNVRPGRGFWHGVEVLDLTNV